MPDLQSLLAIDAQVNAPPAQASPAGGSQFPMVPVHPAPDGSGSMTNLSDADYVAFQKLVANRSAPQPAATPGAGSGSPVQPIDVTPAQPTTAFGIQWNDPTLAAKFSAAEKAINNPQPAAPAGKTTGFWANLGAGAVEGVGNLVGAMGMLPQFQAAKLIGRAAGLPAAGPETLGAAVNQTVANVVPDGKGEELTRAAARGAVSAGPFAAIGGPAAVAMGAVGGAAGQIASDAVPEQWKPLADFLGNLVGGGVVAGGEALLRGGTRLAGGAGRAMLEPLSIGPKEAVVNPETGTPFLDAAGNPVVATPGQQRMAGRKIAGAMGAPPAEAAASIPSPADAALVPGSTPTIGQVTGNVGALNLERQLRGASPENRAAFTRAEGANNSARLAALNGLAPEEAGSAAGRFFQAELAKAQAEEAANVAGSQDAAGNTLTGLGGAPATARVQALGAGQREALEGLRKPEKTRIGRIYDAIDPEGKLALDVSGVADAGKELLGGVNARMGDQIAEAERPVLQAASGMRSVELFSDLRQFLSNVAAAQRAIRADPKLGAESRPFARMTALRQAGEEAIAKAVEEQAGRDAAGNVAPEESILGRITATEGNADAAGASAEAVGTASARSSGALDQPEAAGAAPRSAVASGEGGANQPGRGTAAGDSAVATPAAAPGRQPESLIDFLIAKGGVQDQGGDLGAIGADAIHHKAGGRLVNPKGLTLDYAREAAEQEGFLRPNSTTSDLLDTIADHASGRPRYRISEQADATIRTTQAADAERSGRIMDSARASVSFVEKEVGLRLSQAEYDHAARLVADGEHPEEAIRQALFQGDETTLQRNAEKNAVGSPGVPLAAQQGELPVSGAGALKPNMTPEAAARLKRANAAYAEYKNVYRRGAVGDVLASGNTPSGFRLTDSAVPGRLFQGGPKGAEAADSLIKAAGSPAKALEILGDYPAFSLRAAAEKGGTLDLKATQRWVDAHRAVLDKFPELRARFQNAATAQSAVEQAVARQQARLRAMQDSAAQYYLGKNGEGTDPQVAIGRLLSSENPAREASRLMQLARGDRAATDGIRRNLVEWLLAKARSTAESGTTGEKEIAGGVYQRTIAQPKIAKAVEQILTPEQMDMVRRIGRDIERAARSVNAVRIPGSPGTAADLHALQHGDSAPSMLAQMWIAEKGGEMLAEMGPAHGIAGHLLGLGGAIGGVFHAAMRAAGLANVSRVATEGVLNPELGRVLMHKAVRDPKAPILGVLARRMVAVAGGALVSALPPPEKRR